MKKQIIFAILAIIFMGCSNFEFVGQNLILTGDCMGEKTHEGVYVVKNLDMNDSDYTFEMMTSDLIFHRQTRHDVFTYPKYWLNSEGKRTYSTGLNSTLQGFFKLRCPDSN